MEKKAKDTPENSSPGGLPVIPTPPGTRWREVRVTYFPVLVFALTLVAISILWRKLPPATGVRGIGEGNVSILSAPQDGFVQLVNFEQHGWAEAGQPVMTIVPFDPRSRLDLFQSQLQISRLGLEPSIADRSAIDYEQLRVDALTMRNEVAMAQANLNRAEAALPRYEKLLKENLVTRDAYELVVRDREYYQAEVSEKKKTLEEIENRLEHLRSMVESERPGVNSAMETLIPELEREITALQTNWNPISLVAPISGEVNFLRRENEFVRAGEYIATINAARADRIVAYLRQPMPFEPEVGMTMEVITRSRKPARFLTEISQVGARLEVITNALAYLPPGVLVDSGLPVILPVPDDVQIRPGEIVEVIWKAKAGQGLTERARN